jgi:hypothetical protein
MEISSRSRKAAPLAKVALRLKRRLDASSHARIDLRGSLRRFLNHEAGCRTLAMTRGNLSAGRRTLALTRVGRHTRGWTTESRVAKQFAK